MAGTVSVSVKEASGLRSIEGSKVNFLGSDHAIVKVMRELPGNIFDLKTVDGTPVELEVSGDHIIHVPKDKAEDIKSREEAVGDLDAANVEIDKLKKDVKGLVSKVSALENKLKAPKPKPPLSGPKVGAGGK